MPAWKPVVKNGKFYHYYPKGRDGKGKPEYIYIRPASTATDGGNGTGGASPPAPEPQPNVGPQGQPLPPGTVWDPGAPGVPAPPVAPFLTSDQQLGKIDSKAVLDQTVAEIDSQLRQLVTDTEYSQDQVDKGLKFGTRDTADAMAGRGLFRSSVKDGEIYDLQATAATRKSYLDTVLKNAVVAGDTRKKQARDHFEQSQKAFNQAAVENATAKQASNPWAAPPRPAGPVPAPAQAATAAPAAPAAASKPKDGFQFVQDSGSRKGLSYKVVLKGGKKYRFYENDDKVLVP